MSKHLCHAIGCERPVRPAHLMCWPHWKTVPVPLKEAVWATYRPGQEKDKNPSPEWLQAAARAITAVADREGCEVPEF